MSLLNFKVSLIFLLFEAHKAGQKTRFAEINMPTIGVYTT